MGNSMSTIKVDTINTRTGSGNITFSRPTVLTAGDIVEADIADNAITLAKMAGGVDGNIISYDASGDPVAVVTGSSGQVLTSAGAGAPPTFAAVAGVATSFIGGLTISNNGSDGDHDIDIAVGSARDYTDAVTMTQGTAGLTKRIDATWAVGDGNGGLDSTDTLAVLTGYGVYLIRRSDTGVVDVLISSDMTAAGSALTMPTSYDQKRLIGWIHTDSSANILAFIQSGDYFRILGTNIPSLADTDAGNAKDLTMTCPPLCLAHILAKWNDGAAEVAAEIYIYTKGGAVAGSKMGWIATQHANSDGFYHNATQGMVFTDSGSEISYSCRDTGSLTAAATIEMIGCTVLTRSNP